MKTLAFFRPARRYRDAGVGQEWRLTLFSKPSKNMLYSQFHVGKLTLQDSHIPSRVRGVLMEALWGWHW
jgi:hypothetical protein